MLCFTIGAKTSVTTIRTVAEGAAALRIGVSFRELWVSPQGFGGSASSRPRWVIDNAAGASTPRLRGHFLRTAAEVRPPVAPGRRALPVETCRKRLLPSRPWPPPSAAPLLSQDDPPDQPPEHLAPLEPRGLRRRARAADRQRRRAADEHDLARRGDVRPQPPGRRRQDRLDELAADVLPLRRRRAVLVRRGDRRQADRHVQVREHGGRLHRRARPPEGRRARRDRNRARPAPGRHDPPQVRRRHGAAEGAVASVARARQRQRRPGRRRHDACRPSRSPARRRRDSSSSSGSTA